eukprot:scaffold307_cov63-Phaeocystis_antarctica.AAC.3
MPPNYARSRKRGVPMEVVITAGGMQRFYKHDPLVRAKVHPGAMLAVVDHRHLAQQHHAGGGLASEEMAAGHRVVGVADVMRKPLGWLPVPPCRGCAGDEPHHGRAEARQLPTHYQVVNILVAHLCGAHACRRVVMSLARRQ